MFFRSSPYRTPLASHNPYPDRFLMARFWNLQNSTHVPVSQLIPNPPHYPSTRIRPIKPLGNFLITFTVGLTVFPTFSCALSPAHL